MVQHNLRAWKEGVKDYSLGGLGALSTFSRIGSLGLPSSPNAIAEVSEIRDRLARVHDASPLPCTPLNVEGSFSPELCTAGGEQELRTAGGEQEHRGGVAEYRAR